MGKDQLSADSRAVLGLEESAPAVTWREPSMFTARCWGCTMKAPLPPPTKPTFNGLGDITNFLWVKYDRPDRSQYLGLNGQRFEIKGGKARGKLFWIRS